MYITLWQRSPCEKMAWARPYSTICFESPAESRNACALKIGMRLAIQREYAAGHETRVHNGTGDPFREMNGEVRTRHCDGVLAHTCPQLMWRPVETGPFLVSPREPR